MKKAARIEIYSDSYKIAQIYTISATLSNEQVIFIASQLLTNNDNWRVFLLTNGELELIDSNLHSTKTKESKWLEGTLKQYVDEEHEITEIAYHPEVTDNLANTLKKMIEQKFNYVFNECDAIYSSKLFIGGHNCDYTPLIQKCEIVTAAKKKVAFYNASINSGAPITKKIDLADLKSVSKQRLLGLSPKAIEVIEQHFKNLRRRPTDIELETLAQTWSEHCKHTIFSSPIDEIEGGLYKTYIKAATEQIMRKKKGFCISVFSDNAGAISFTEDWLIAAKVETHNSPSALEPFGGAITGILGVNRDIIGFGMGAKPIANTYGFCFADPTKKYNFFRDKNLTVPVLAPQKIIDGVIEGVNVGGNCSGIPTLQGFVFYDEGFIAKPLVFVGTIGLIPRTVGGKSSHMKGPQIGDYIVIIGGHTGKDGIHGATFSSEALNTDTPSSAVQIGDPITQKKLSDAIIKEARDLGLYNAITDNGAGGLSSSVGEMGKNGFELRLEKVPLKYRGMNPWEIWVSESQERMTLAVPQEKYGELYNIMQKHDVHISKIGTFNRSGKAIITYYSEVILDLGTNFLHNGNPIEHLNTQRINTISKSYYTKEINLQERNFISEQYDHEVQGLSILKPIQGVGKVSADATVIKPVLSLNCGIALSQGLGVLLDDQQDPYYMAANAIDTAIRNVVAVGANPEKIALLDNFCWSKPTDKKRLWQLKSAADACYDYAGFFNTPFISGKDSMFNDFKGYDGKGKKVHLTDPPVLLITAVGIVDDVERCVSLDVKFPGDLVYLLGKGNARNIDAQTAYTLYKQAHKAISRDLVASAISVNCGGLLHAIGRSARGGMLNIEIADDHYRELVNEEYPSRILVTINPANKNKFEKLFSEYILLGKVAD